MADEQIKSYKIRTYYEDDSQKIVMAPKTCASAVDCGGKNLKIALDEKQNNLEAGPGITITGNQISANPGLKIQKIDAFPPEGNSETIYLKPSTTSKNQNVFDEYLYVDKKWELIGSTQVDLTNYARKDQSNTFSAMQVFDQNVVINGNASDKRFKTRNIIGSSGTTEGLGDLYLNYQNPSYDTHFGTNGNSKLTRSGSIEFDNAVEIKYNSNTESLEFIFTGE